ESNACEVLHYIKENFECIKKDDGYLDNPSPIEGVEDDYMPTAPNPEVEEEEEFDESQRKPIWWYHSDHLGSSSYLTDNFGRPTHYYDQLPFGESMVEHNQSQYYGNQYKFNGKELDAATGMYYYGARYYDPRLSIFISVDPLAEQTMEPYQYVSNNPIMLIDPDGMSPISVFAKMAAKSGLKQTAKSTVKSVITNRLKAYSSKGWAKQLMGDALDAIDMAMGQAWWEYAIEVIPIAGDAYGGYKLTDQGVTVWKLVQRIEN